MKFCWLQQELLGGTKLLIFFQPIIHSSNTGLLSMSCALKYRHERGRIENAIFPHGAANGMGSKG